MELFSSSPSSISGSSTPVAVTNTSAAEATNWTEFSCSWLDEVYDIQNDFYWQHTSSTEILVLYAFVCSFGGLANLFVIVAFARTSHLRNLRNYFIVNLAFSDLMLCAVTAPVTLYLTLNLFWPFGNVACQMMASIQAVNMFVSCLTLVLIALDRFLLTLCPVKWRLAAKAPVVCYLVVWLTSVLVAAPYFFAVSAEPVTMFDPWNSAHAEHMLSICKRKRPEICIEKAWHRLPFSRRTYTLSVLAIQYVLPLSALIYSYSQIGSTIRKRVKYSTTVDFSRKQLLTKRNRKALLLLLSLIVTYACAWLPINAYNVLNVLDIIEFSQYRYIFCHLIGMSSACINPILYALINDSFRSAFLVMLRPFFRPCTKYVAVGGGGSGGAGGHPPHYNHHQPQHTHTTFSSTVLPVNNHQDLGDTPEQSGSAQSLHEQHFNQEMLGCNGRTCPGTLGAISDLLPVKQNNSEIQPMIVPLPVSQLVIGASEHQLSDEEEEDYEEEQEQEVDTPLTLLNPRKNNLINNNNSRLSDEEPLKQPLFSGLQIDSPC